MPGEIPVTARVGVLRTPGLSATDDVLRGPTPRHVSRKEPRLEQHVFHGHSKPELLSPRWGAVLSLENRGTEAGHLKGLLSDLKLPSVPTLNFHEHQKQTNKPDLQNSRNI